METTILQEKETIELTKNAKGEYQWSIKVKAVMLTNVDLQRLADIDNHLKSVYGAKK